MKTNVKRLICSLSVLLILSTCLCCCMARPSAGNGTKPEPVSDSFKPSQISELDARLEQYELYRERAESAFDSITDTHDGELEYSDTEDGVRIDGYIGQSDIIVIPEKINGKSVLEIAEGAFANSNMRSLYIPDSVRKIGKGALSGCTRLQLIRLPFIGDGESATHIGYIFGADSYDKNAINIPTSLETVVVGALEKNISDRAFYRAKSIDAVLLEGAQTIGKFAFYECDSLVYAGLPDAGNIGEYAFAGCGSLSSIELEGAESIGLGAFYLCRAMAQMSLPFIGDGGDNAYLGYIFGAESSDWNENFVPSSLLSIRLFEGCESIDDKAFANCKSLAEIILPESLVSIGVRAFVNCRSLAALKTPAALRIISDDAFFGCDHMTALEITGATNVGKQAFFGCDRLTEITISDGAVISDTAFNKNINNINTKNTDQEEN